MLFLLLSASRTRGTPTVSPCQGPDKISLPCLGLSSAALDTQSAEEEAGPSSPARPGVRVQTHLSQNSLALSARGAILVSRVIPVGFRLNRGLCWGVHVWLLKRNAPPLHKEGAAEVRLHRPVGSISSL